MEDIRGVRLRKFKLRKIVLGVRMHFHHNDCQGRESVEQLSALFNPSMGSNSKTTEQRTITQQHGDCTLAVNGWAVTFGRARKGLQGGLRPPQCLLAVPNVTAHSSTASYQRLNLNENFRHSLVTMQQCKMDISILLQCVIYC